ncbi:MAG: hypothetical protein WC797_00025, partial [Candidatus Paceibacterota bacterium]
MEVVYIGEESTPTCAQIGNWKEYRYTLEGHSVGYFWKRTDGLRIGHRKAGEYYKRGKIPLSSPRPPSPAEVEDISWGQAYFDTGNRILMWGDSGSKEHLPDHIRVINAQGDEIALLTTINGVSIICFLDNLEKILDIIDKKWPLGQTGL